MGIIEYCKKYCWVNTKLVTRVVLFKLFKHPHASEEEVKYIKFVWDEHIRYYKTIFRHPSRIISECRQCGLNIANAYENLNK